MQNKNKNKTTGLLSESSASRETGTGRGPQSCDITIKILKRITDEKNSKLRGVRWFKRGLKVSYYQIPNTNPNT